MISGQVYLPYMPLEELPVFAIGEITQCTVVVKNTGVVAFRPMVLCQLMQRRNWVDYNDCEVVWHTAGDLLEPGDQVTMMCQQRVCEAGASCGGNAGAGPHWGRIALHGVLEDGTEIVIDDLAGDTAGIPVAEVYGEPGADSQMMEMMSLMLMVVMMGMVMGPMTEGGG
ncbi:MAG: hypothetical protein SVP26_03255 [Chloroflexota bacterium]|nr:hypothetical protein [Chloroflexota bacterium]